MTETKKEKRKLKTTINLEFPVQWGEEEISTLELRRPKAKDIENLPDKPRMKDLLAIASRISAQPPRVISELDAADAIKVCEAVGDFLANGREIGGMDS